METTIQNKNKIIREFLNHKNATYELAIKALRNERKAVLQAKHDAIPRDIILKDNFIPYGMEYKMPQYGIVGGLCVFSGLISFYDIKSNPEIGLIPSECSLNAEEIFDVHTDSNTNEKTMRLDVTRPGVMEYKSGAIDGNWFSLDGKFYIKKESAEKLKPLTLSKGWMPMERIYSKPGYFIEEEFCVVTGVIEVKKQVEGNLDQLAVLPKECRPHGDINFVVNTDAKSQLIKIEAATGIIGIVGSKAYDEWISLNGILFLVPQTNKWITSPIPLNLEAGWESGKGNSLGPQYKKIREFCIVEGNVIRKNSLPASDNHVIFSLPQECRPESGHLKFGFEDPPGFWQQIEVRTDGNVVWSGGPNSLQSLSLSSIHFLTAPEQGWEVAKELHLQEIIRKLEEKKEAEKAAALEVRKRDIMPTAITLSDNHEVHGQNLRIPSWSKVGRLCVLTGMSENLLTSKDQILGRTPQSCLPSTSHQYHFLESGSVAVMDVGTDGVIKSKYGSSSPTNRSSFDGIMYLTQSGLLPQNVDFEVGKDWKLEEGAFLTVNKLFGDLCIIEGKVSSVTKKPSEKLGTIAEQCRPDFKLFFSVASYPTGKQELENIVIVHIEILPSGEILWSSNNPVLTQDESVTVSFERIQFVTKQGKKLAIKQGFKKGDVNYREPTFNVAGEYCLLSGVFQAVGGIELTTLPSECIPDSGDIIVQTSSASTQSSTVNRIRQRKLVISETGAVRFLKGFKDEIVSLDGIAFALFPEQQWETDSKMHIDRMRAQRKEELRLAEEKQKAKVIEENIKKFQRATIPSPLDAEKSFVQFGHGYRVLQYARSGKVCLISGSILTANNSEILGAPMIYIPSNCRPANKIAFQRSVSIKQNGVQEPVLFEVTKEGELTYGKSSSIGTVTTVSGVTYATNDVSSTLLPLSDYYVPFGEGYAAPSFVLEGDFCVVSGKLKLKNQYNEKQWNENIGTLPSSCRPEAKLTFSVARDGSKTGKFNRVDVYPTGKLVWADGVKDKSFINLDGIAFFTSSAPKKPLMLSKQSSPMKEGFRIPSFFKQNNLCGISGTIKVTGGGSEEVLIGSIPSDCMPKSGNLSFIVNHGSNVDLVDVRSNGDIVWTTSNTRAGDSLDWLSLDGINYLIADPQPWEEERASRIESEQKRLKAEADALQTLLAEKRKKLAIAQSFVLQNGFRVYDRSFKVPSFSRFGSVCFLSGVTELGIDNEALITDLPPICQPKITSESLLFSGFSEDGKSSRFEIASNGNLKLNGGSLEDFKNSLSFETVAFVVGENYPGVEDVAFKLKGAWNSSESQPVSAKLEKDLCVLQGTVQLSKLEDFQPEIIELSKSCRPDKRLVFNAPYFNPSNSSHVSTHRVDVFPNGSVIWKAGNIVKTDDSALVLSNIMFFSISDNAIPLNEDWVNVGSSYRAASFRLYEKLCMLSGVVKGSKAKIAILPENCRPSSRSIFFVNRDDNPQRLDVLPDGSIMWMNKEKRSGFISLEGIRFFVQPLENWEKDAITKAETRIKLETESAIQAFFALSLSKPLKIPQEDVFGYSYSVPRFARYGDICFLHGTIHVEHGDSQNAFEIGSLTDDCKPKNLVMTHTQTAGVSYARLTLGEGIDQKKINVQFQKETNDTWLPLDGAVFPVDNAKNVIELTPGADWNINSLSNGAPTLTVDHDMCALSGLVISKENHRNDKSVIVQLPSFCRPKGGDLVFNSFGKRIVVKTNGDVISASDSGVVLSLNRVFFFPTATQSIKLLNDHAPYTSEGFRPPSFTRAGQLCVLSGVLRGSGKRLITTLPENCRPPSGRLVFSVESEYTLSERVDVLPDGHVIWVTGLHKKRMLSLDGIGFFVNAISDWESLILKERQEQIQAAIEAKMADLISRAEPKRLELNEDLEPFGHIHKIPQIMRFGDICVLSGQARSKHGEGGATPLFDFVTMHKNITQVPAFCHPEKTLIFDGHTSNTGTYRVDFDYRGRLLWKDGEVKSKYVSFNGIMFPSAAIKPTSLELGSLFKPYDNETGFEAPGFVKANGLCMLLGTAQVKDFTLWKEGVVIAKLPTECTPKDGRLVFNANSGAATHRVDVTTAGEVIWMAGELESSFVSLSNIAFFPESPQRLDNAKPKLLEEGYYAYGGQYRPPSFVKKDLMCVLSGLIRGSGNFKVLKLPEECIPAFRFRFSVNRNVFSETLEVREDGEVIWIEGAKKEGFLSLDGIRFMVVPPMDWELRMGKKLEEEFVAEQSVKEEDKKKEEEKKQKRQEEQSKKQEEEDNKLEEKLKKQEKEELEREQKEERERKAAEEEKEKSGHRLELSKSVLPYGRGFAVPQFIKLGGLCMLQGVGYAKNLHSLLATAPPECRPAAKSVFVTAIDNGGTSDMSGVLLTVDKEGKVEWMEGGDTSISKTKMSFSGLVYPVKNADIMDLYFDNEWVVYEDSDYFDPVYYLYEDEFCVLEGVVTTDTRTVNSIRSSVSRLPFDCRPRDGTIIVKAAAQVGFIRLDIKSDGRAIIDATAHGRGWSNPPWISLSGIAFFSGQNGRKLDLAEGLSVYGGEYRPPQYQIIDKLCGLSGLVRTYGYQKPLVTVLPAGCRPSRSMEFTVSHHDRVISVTVYDDGRVKQESGHLHHGWIGLDGIYFVTGQNVLRIPETMNADLSTEKIPLFKSWNAFKPEEYREPEWQRIGQICVLSGVATSDDIKRQMSELPKECRPAFRHIFALYASKDTEPMRLDVAGDGTIQWMGGEGNGNWVSLDGILFPVRGASDFFMSLESPLVSYGRGYSLANYVLDGNHCLVTGVVRHSNWNNIGQTHLARLPPECTPQDGTLVFGVDHHQFGARVDVNVYGQVYISYLSNRAHPWISFDGIAFFPHSETGLKLHPPFYSYENGYRVPSLNVQKQLCSLSGSTRQSGGGAFIGKLPDYCRPNKRLILFVNQHYHGTRIDILKDGRVIWVDFLYFGYSWLPLDGLRFIADYKAEAESPDYRISNMSTNTLELLNEWTVVDDQKAPRIYNMSGLCIIHGAIQGMDFRKSPFKVPKECGVAQELLFFAAQPNTRDAWALYALKTNNEVIHRLWDYSNMILQSFIYPSKGLMGQPIALDGLWYPYGEPLAPPMYYKVGGLCVLSGTLKSLRGLEYWNPNLGMVGSDCAPLDGGTVLLGVSKSFIDVMFLDAHGHLIRYRSNSAQVPWISLSGIVYSARRGHLLNFYGGRKHWRSDCWGHRMPSWKKEGNLCILEGCITPTGDRNPIIAELPAICHPPAYFTKPLEFQISCQYQTCRASVNSRGEVRMVSPIDSFMHLNGITFVSDTFLNVSVDDEEEELESLSAEGEPLKLEKGLQNYGHGFRNAMYTIVGDLCIISGVVKAIKGQSIHTKYFTLPEECRPRARQSFFLLNGNIFTVGNRIDVLPDGQVVWKEDTEVNKGENNWMSFDAIVFVVSRAADAMHSYQEFVDSKWVNANKGGYERVGYYKDGETLCVFHGRLEWYQMSQTQTTSHQMIGRLPSECTPDRNVRFNTAMISHKVYHTKWTSTVYFSPGGKLYRYNPTHGVGHTSYVVLDGSLFHTTGNIPLTLTKNCQTHKDSKPPSYKRTKNLCVVTGLGYYQSKGTFAILPEECRPRERVYFNVHDGNGDSTYTYQQVAGHYHVRYQRFDVFPDGRIVAVFDRSREYAYFDGIRFVVPLNRTVPKSAVLQSTNDFSSQALNLSARFSPYKRGYADPKVQCFGVLCMFVGVGMGEPLMGDFLELPGQVKPVGRLVFGMHTRSGKSFAGELLKDGLLRWKTGAFDGNMLGLDGLIFAVEGSPQGPLMLGSSWVTKRDYVHAYWIRQGDLCVVSGYAQLDPTSAVAEAQHNVKQNPSLYAELAILPEQCRPKDGVITFALNTLSETTTVSVNEKGVIMYFDGFHPGRNHEVSFSGITFFIESPKLLRLNDKWKNYNNGWRVASYNVDNKLCVVSGLLCGNRERDVVTLPFDCRPEKHSLFYVTRGTGNRDDTGGVRIDVHEDGRIVWEEVQDEARSYNGCPAVVSLDGIRFIRKSED